jgi:hypothetical protein
MTAAIRAVNSPQNRLTSNREKREPVDSNRPETDGHSTGTGQAAATSIPRQNVRPAHGGLPSSRCRAGNR